MNRDDVIRAWKDPLFRASLSREQRSALPAHPAGVIELRDEDLKAVAGGIALITAQTCTEFTFRNFRACCPK
jgi:mersacidin/lichenicidin family type 2 lantibiotic